MQGLRAGGGDVACTEQEDTGSLLGVLSWVILIQAITIFVLLRFTITIQLFENLPL